MNGSAICGKQNEIYCNQINEVFDMKLNSESIMIIVAWICVLIGSAFVDNSLPFAFAFMFTIAVLNAKNKE